MEESTKLTKTEAVSILIALINQGKIELSCLKKFNEFRKWELDQSRPDIEKFQNIFDFNISARRNDLCRMAASLDAEYLKTFLEVLMSNREARQQSLDAWNFVNDLRLLRDKIELNSLEKEQSI